jgi:predicted nucleic acid-binding protein
MIDALLDTTVIIHLFRKYQPALDWLSIEQFYAITPITWLEVMEGASNKTNQIRCKTILNQFILLDLTPTDQHWAMEQLERFQFTHHISKYDCLIASVAYRLQMPLCTHNLKHMTPLIGNLAVQPYA